MPPLNLKAYTMNPILAELKQMKRESRERVQTRVAIDRALHRLNHPRHEEKALHALLLEMPEPTAAQIAILEKYA